MTTRSTKRSRRPFCSAEQFRRLKAVKRNEKPTGDLIQIYYPKRKQSKK